MTEYADLYKYLGGLELYETWFTPTPGAATAGRIAHSIRAHVKKKLPGISVRFMVVDGGLLVVRTK